MPKEKNFVEIVREMVEGGHDLKEIVENLETLGLERKDAEKLVSIMEGKALPSMQRQVDELVGKKIISKNAAMQIRLERRSRSAKRREEAKWSKAFRLSDDLVREFAPEKHLAFKQRWRNMSKARKQLALEKKEMQALLLEIEEKNLPYRAKSKIKKALELLE